MRTFWAQWAAACRQNTQKDVPSTAGSGPCRAPGTEVPGQAEQGASSRLVLWAGCWWRLLQAWMKRARPCSGSALGAVPHSPRPGAAAANHFPSFRLAAAHPSCTSVMPAFQTGVVPMLVALLSPSSFQVAFGVLELDFRCFVLSRVQQICSELHLLLCCVLALVLLPPVLLRQAAAPGACSHLPWGSRWLLPAWRGHGALRFQMASF